MSAYTLSTALVSIIYLAKSTPNVLVQSVIHSELQTSSISVIIGCLHVCKVSHSSKKWVRVSSDLPHMLHVASLSDWL